MNLIVEEIIPEVFTNLFVLLFQYAERSRTDNFVSRDSPGRFSHSLDEQSRSVLLPNLPGDCVEMYEEVRPVPDLEVSRDSTRSDDSYCSNR